MYETITLLYYYPYNLGMSKLVGILRQIMESPVLTADRRIVCSGITSSLDQWLVPIPANYVERGLQSLSVSLAPDGAYFAFDKNGSAWGSLPSRLTP